MSEATFLTNEELAEKYRLMLTPKWILAGATVEYGFLTDYIESSNDYNCETLRNRKLGAETLPRHTSLQGYVKFPGLSKGTREGNKPYAFMFVELDDVEGKQALRDLATGNLHPGYFELVERRKTQLGPGATEPKDEPKAPPPAKEPIEEKPAEQEFDPADTDKDGTVSNKERRKAEKNK